VAAVDFVFIDRNTPVLWWEVAAFLVAGTRKAGCTIPAMEVVFACQTIRHAWHTRAALLTGPALRLVGGLVAIHSALSLSQV